MSFWSTQSIRDRGSAIIDPFNEDDAREGSYPLKMGPQAAISCDPAELKNLSETDSSIFIPSGQFALLLTEERIRLPLNTIAFISLKTRLKKKGLINVSGFHVDPGYSGRLKFWVYNAGNQTIPIQRGDHAFAIWLSSLDKEDSRPFARNGTDNDKITSDDLVAMQGTRASPAALKAEIDSIRGTLTQDIEKLRIDYQHNHAWMQAILGIVLAAFLALVALMLEKVFGDSPAPPNLNVNIGARPHDGQSREVGVDKLNEDFSVRFPSHLSASEEPSSNTDFVIKEE